MSRLKIFIFAAFFALLTTPVHAQVTGALNPQNDVTIQVTPRFPEPNQEITLALNDYTLNTTGAQFFWSINGVAIEQFNNERSITIQSGALGDSTKVSVTTKLASGLTYTTTTTIKPTRVDLVVEADTITPSFYTGKNLPSSGSPVRVTAIPFITTNNSTPGNYSYTWHVGSEIVNGGSQYGKNYTIFESSFEKNMEVSVDVYDTQGVLLTSKTTYVPVVEPELYFYEINPLTGIQTTALRSNTIFTSNEITVRAEPYFMDRQFMQDNPYIEWKINGITTENNSSDPQEITLQKTAGTGSVRLDFHVRNLSQLLQGVKDTITLTF